MQNILQKCHTCQQIVHQGLIDMANQRDPRKRRVTIWLLPEERRMLQRLARETGGNMTEVIKNRIAAYARKKKNAKP